MSAIHYSPLSYSVSRSFKLTTFCFGTVQVESSRHRHGRERGRFVFRMFSLFPYAFRVGRVSVR